MRLYTILFLILSSTLYAQQNEEPYKVNSAASEHNNQGYLLLENGQYKEAISQFEEAIALDSSQLIYYYNLAIAFSNTRNYEGALKTYNNAKIHFPNEADLYMFVGDILQKQNKYIEAVDEYSKAIEFVKDENPNKYLIYFNRGNSYLKLKQYQNAITNYNSTLIELPNYYGALANRGMAYYNLRNKSQACSDWNKAAKNGYSVAKRYIARYCD